ncbi:MAG: hypothetical protein ACRYF4_08310 [Janthinobacterium lividum]
MSVLKHVKVLRSLQIAVFALPLLGQLVEHQTAIPFPPVGDHATTYRYFAMLMVAIAAIIPYFTPNRWHRKPFVIALFFSFIGLFCTYLHLEGNFVLPLEDGSLVVRGSVRNPKLQLPYSAESDQDLIEDAGSDDASLLHVYTAESLQANREKVYFSYVLSLIAMEFTLGLAVVTGDVGS